MKSKMEQPTIFMSGEEVEEAIEFGYINNLFGTRYGYEEGGGNSLPTMFWADEQGCASHQPNEKGIWSKEIYIKLIQKSIMWSDIREQYKPKEWYEKPNAFPRLCWVWGTSLSNKKKIASVIKKYENGFEVPFLSDGNGYWTNAEPVTEEDLKCTTE